MTLPTDIILPLRPEQIKSGDPAQLELYMRDLVNSLTEWYQDSTQVINGSLQQWTPTVYGTTSAGTGTYARQTGWYLRQGLMVDLWFDVAWSAHTGSGNLAILLPYKVAKSDNQPWVGVIQSKGLNNFGAGTYLVMNAQPDSTEGTIVTCGSGIASSSIALAGNGGIVGHIRYVGQQFEN
jgi:hypothetical protein